MRKYLIFTVLLVGAFTILSPALKTANVIPGDPENTPKKVAIFILPDPENVVVDKS